MSNGGKGSRPRPYTVDRKTFENNWDAIFGDKQKKQEQDKDTQDSDQEGQDQADNK